MNVIIVDETKLSDRLGEKWPIPVEVLGFGHKATVRALERFGKVTLRLRNEVAWLTDSGNLIYDVHTGPLENPAETERALRAIPGVVETGLFIGRADRVIVAGETGITELFPRR